MNVICVMAQEQDPWVGTWTSGIFQEHDYDSKSYSDYTDYRYVIRITKNGDNYRVRSKLVKVSDPNKAFYNLYCTFNQIVKQTNEKYMLFETYDETIVSKSLLKTRSYYKLSLNNEVLQISFYKEVTDHFDENGRYKCTTTYGLNERYRGYCFVRDLYNDDW